VKWLKWAALPVTDRRWAAPLSAVALGFGVFAGVAIGPGAAGTLATGAAQLIEIPVLGGDQESGQAETTAEVAPERSSDGSGEGGATEASSSFAEFSEDEFESSTTEATPSAPDPSPPVKDPQSQKQSLTGVVVHVNPAAGSYTLAEAEGALDVVHAGKLPRPTTKLSVPVRGLANGTFAEDGKRKRAGTKVRAKLEGIVTYVDETAGAPAYTVSKRGVSVLVHVHPDPSGAPPSPLPALGALARVAVDIGEPSAASESPAAHPGTEAPPDAAQPGCAPDPTSPPLVAIEPAAVLWQRHLDVDGAPLAYGDFEGIVTAVCPESGQLLVSADDVRESEADLLFELSEDGIDLTRLRIGDSILATATIGAEGKLSLTGLAGDEHMKGADDVKALQGDLAED
jgi:hypothetical protein